MPDATTRGDPPDLGAEAEQHGQGSAIPEPPYTDAAGQDQHQPDIKRCSPGVDDGLPDIGPHGSNDGDERHQEDRRERRERDVDARPDDHVVVGTEPAQKPRPTMEKGVGQVEEVPSARIEAVVAQEVDDEGRDDERGRGDRRRNGGEGEGLRTRFRVTSVRYGAHAERLAPGPVQFGPARARRSVQVAAMRFQARPDQAEEAMTPEEPPCRREPVRIGATRQTTKRTG